MKTIINYVEDSPIILYEYIREALQKEEPDIYDLFDSSPDLLYLEEKDIYLTDVIVDNTRYCLWFDPEYRKLNGRIEDILENFWNDKMPGFMSYSGDWSLFYSWECGIAYRGATGKHFKLWKYDINQM